MRVNGVAADGLLLPEEVPVSGPILVLRLLEEGIDARQRGWVVVAGELLCSGPVEGRLLHGHIVCDSCGLYVNSGRSSLPVTADEEGGKGDQNKASTAPRQQTVFQHSPTLPAEEADSRGCLEQRCWKQTI